MPVFDSEGNFIEYSAEEVEPDGYTGEKTKDLHYEYIITQEGAPTKCEIDKETTCSIKDFYLSYDMDLAYVVIKTTAGEPYKVWTHRPATDREKEMIVNAVQGDPIHFNVIENKGQDFAYGTPYTYYVPGHGSMTITMEETTSESGKYQVTLTIEQTKTWAMFAYG